MSVNAEGPWLRRPVPARGGSTQAIRREREVLRLLASGMSTSQMADAVAIQPVTARNHITRLLTKLGVGNRLQAVVYASEHKLI